MNLISIKPQFRSNYDAGYIGFTFTDECPVSEGIAFFERWNRLSDIRVSHVFVVTGDVELVEAQMEHGVQKDSIAKYFNDPHTIVFFRKPRGWSPELGQRIASAAASKIGTPYATGLIVADLLADSFLGHWLNVTFQQWPRRIVNKFLARPAEFIC
jgi:hypothetical protein